MGRRAKVLEETRQQQDIKDTPRKTCEETLQKTLYGLPAENYRNIKTTKSSESRVTLLGMAPIMPRSAWGTQTRMPLYAT